MWVETEESKVGISKWNGSICKAWLMDLLKGLKSTPIRMVVMNCMLEASSPTGPVMHVCTLLGLTFGWRNESFSLVFTVDHPGSCIMPSSAGFWKFKVITPFHLMANNAIF